LLITQNIPEGFNAYREIISTTAASRQKVLAIFFALTLLGPLSAYVGMTYFSHNVSLMGGLMLFCSGGILYLTFQDIAPAAKLENHWGPALGACGGFVLGLVGFVLTQA
jgi:ZIP family zinc transporter